MTATQPHPIATQFAEVSKHLNTVFLERKDAIAAMLLAVLSGEHVFLLGPPGTAKSQMVRALVKTLINARYFEVALSKTRPTEAVLGPLNIKEFRENGNYFLKRRGYASDVEFAFFDEIGKMSPVLGHDLLALLNERIYHEVNGGLSHHTAPLSSAFCASNELMTDESDDAAALWDRLLFRVTVDYLQDHDNFATLLTADMPDVDVKIDWEELQQVITEVVPNIELTERAVKGLVSLRGEFAREHIYPSDRRWRASVKALQAAAFLDGRNQVEQDDIAVLRYTLWDTVEQIEKVTRLCMEAANPFVRPLFDIAEQIKEVESGVKEREGLDSNGNDQTAARRQYGKEAMKKLTTARDKLDSLLIDAEGRRIPGFKAASDEHRRVMKRVFMSCLEQSDEEAEVMMKNRLGSGDGGNV